MTDEERTALIAHEDQLEAESRDLKASVVWMNRRLEELDRLIEEYFDNL